MIRFALILSLALFVGCEYEPAPIAALRKPDLEGVVQDIMPMGVVGSRSRILLRFEDGRIHQINFYGNQTRDALMPGKYQEIYLDSANDILRIVTKPDNQQPKPRPSSTK